MKNIIAKLLIFSFLTTAALNTYSQASEETPDEVLVGAWNGEVFTYEFQLDSIKALITETLAQNLGLDGTIASLTISDLEPSNDSSIAYLVYKVVIDDSTVTFGHRLIRRYDEDADTYKYFINSTQLSEYENDPESDPSTEDAAAYKCTTPSGCNGCIPKRRGFLGLGGVYECNCSNNTSKCTFEKSGGTFPWSAVISVIVAVGTIIYNHNNK